MKVSIVGGGISGLATAFFVQRARPDWEIEVFDACPRIGGTMQTESVDGYLFEAGGNGFLTNKPDTLALVRDSGAEDLLMPSSDLARVRYVYTDALHRLPESPPTFLRTRLLTLPQKLRVLAEVFLPPRRTDEEESVESFGNRRLGRAFTDVFLNAMTAGIYASTPADISVNAAFPMVVELERQYGGLFRGMWKKRRKQAGPGGVLTSFRGGVGTFIDHLVAAIRGQIYQSEPVMGLQRQDGGFSLVTSKRQSHADKVVLATPAYSSAELIEPIDDELARHLWSIEYSPIAVVGFGYDNIGRSLDGFGLLTTASAHKEVLGILWDSSIFPDRAPAGKQALRVMIGGRRNPELAMRNRDELENIALRGIRETMGSSVEPTVSFCRCWPRGIPNYAVGHLTTVAAVFQGLRRHPGLYLTSNAYRGIGLNDCVASAKRTAVRLVGDRLASQR